MQPCNNIALRAGNLALPGVDCVTARRTDTAAQARDRAVRARYAELEAKLDRMEWRDDAIAYDRLDDELNAEKLKRLPYDATTLSYREWTALPQEEQREVVSVLRRRAIETHPNYLAMSEAERDAYDAEHYRLVRDLVDAQRRTGAELFGSVVIGKRHVIKVWDGIIQPQPPLRFDPTTLTYRQWMALPPVQQEQVMSFLRAIRTTLRARAAAMTEAEKEAEFRRLLQDVSAEEDRTGIVRPGWIFLGNGATVHRLVAQLPPGKRWG